MVKTTEISEVPIIEFEVDDGGTLRMADYADAERRADFDDYVPNFWSDSPKDLVEAMDECQPLAWAVGGIYFEFRAGIKEDLRDTQGDGSLEKRRRASLATRLEMLPEEPEEGAVEWLLGLSCKEFDHWVVSEIDKWLDEPPDWGSEQDYLPESGTAKGAALEYFQNMAIDKLETLGVEVIEGEHPGSTYYAAELTGDIDVANRAAEASGIPVRFVAAKD